MAEAIRQVEATGQLSLRINLFFGPEPRKTPARSAQLGTGTPKG
ncbi:MAG: hypothetical protein AVDCRST_MAG37-3445 [uncultured Rubrobacteraceae bacterium]|uniref:Uncharacterized protein n=1 Tax=uncultured Rubrobacteraceae bacterium TaxID=349277 RepID=A0A6J4QYN3_9ACTN|nr:MAG: hypothetical protein AVDCRST_MAG37-3445 [uncultured Rubrobacteraceae bacterium]